MQDTPLALLDESASFTARDKLDLSRELHSSFTSSDRGLSEEEIVCEEVDDILPKTDYTYSKTATYSTKYATKKRYSSPNMSRRRIRGSQPDFLSDDEDDFEDRDENVTAYGSRSLYQQRHTGDMDDITSSEQGSETGLVRGRRSRARNVVYTSTPHQQHHISTHDHYYDGMLLRSGHKIEGVKWHVDKDGMVYQYDDSGLALLPTPIGHSSELDMSKMRGSLTTISTVSSSITTTTTTTRRQQPQRGRKSLKMNADEMSERKLKLDETENEKHGGKKGQIVLKHLYGLDSDGDLSDVDDVDFGRSTKAVVKASQNHSKEAHFWFFSYMYTVITTVITTVTSTVTEGSLASGVKSAVVAATKPVVWPASWLMRRIVDFLSWLVTQAATLILMEVWMKQRRRRAGCCCLWLFPLLLLLPLALLGLYYWSPLVLEASHLSQAGVVTSSSLGASVYTGLGEAVSATQGALAGGWTYMLLWFSAWSTAASSSKSQPPPVTPLPQTPAAAGIDLAQLHLYIQQTVEQTWQAKGEHFQQQLEQIQVPAGMTRAEVEAIVAAALATEMADLKGGVDRTSSDLKGLLEAHSVTLEARIAGLEAEMKRAAQEQQVIIGNLDQTKASFEGFSVEEKSQWLVKSAALEAQLADLSASVGQLSSQNAALTALVGNCCRNSSLLADTVKAHVFAVLAEMGTDKDSPLSGLLGWMGSQYVGKSELDQRLEAASADVQERVMALLLAKMEEERKEREMQTAVEADREKTETAAVHLHAGQTGSIDEAMVKSIVDEALIQFSADRVGLPDFALESAGGSVLSVRCSETYYHKTALVSVFGLPLWYTSNSPRTVIQPNVHPGECWAFKGQHGYIVLQLSHPIQVTGFTLEHIPRSLAPRGIISSAPHKLSVFGLTSESDTQGLNLGNYTYEDDGRPIQHFDVQNRHPGIFQLIELRVLSNHGNPEYTCIYRFRVHGMP